MCRIDVEKQVRRFCLRWFFVYSSKICSFHSVTGSRCQDSLCLFHAETVASPHPAVDPLRCRQRQVGDLLLLDNLMVALRAVHRENFDGLRLLHRTTLRGRWGGIKQKDAEMGKSRSQIP